MPKFAKIKNNLIPNCKPYWMLYIEDMVDLADYIEKVKGKRIAENYQSAKYKTIPDANNQAKGHFSKEEFAIYNILTHSKKKRLSFIDDLMILSDVLYSPMNKCIANGDILLVNISGGFHPYNEKYDSFTILQIIEKDKYEFPVDVCDEQNLLSERDKLIKMINITRWEMGKHYYAKIGEHDVKYGGMNKWSSYELARNYSEKYIDNVLLKMGNPLK